MAYVESYIVSTQSAMLNLAYAKVNDTCRRTDLNLTFILTAMPASNPGNWVVFAPPNETQNTPEWFNVTDYGATGNGVANDAAAFQDAIDAAAVVNGVVYIPTGSYRIETSLSVPGGSIRFLGDSWGSNIVTHSAINVFNVTGNNDGISWENLSFFAYGAGCVIFYFGGSAVECLNTIFRNVIISGSVTGAGSYCTALAVDTAVLQVQIENCKWITDSCIRFGTPAGPIQINNFRATNSWFGMGGSTSVAATLDFCILVGSPITFDDCTFEGTFPGSNAPALFRFGGGQCPVEFSNCEFADFDLSETPGNSLFIAASGLVPGPGQITFDTTQIENGNGSLFDWSAGSGGNAPFIVFINCGAVDAGNNQQVFKSATDTSGGFFTLNSELGPAQTSLSSNGNVLQLMSSTGATTLGILLRMCTGGASPLQILGSAGALLFIVTALGELQFPKQTTSASAPGAGAMMLRAEAGTNSGTLKLVAYAGTSSTGVTVIDNIGAGN